MPPGRPGNATYRPSTRRTSPVTNVEVDVLIWKEDPIQAENKQTVEWCTQRNPILGLRNGHPEAQTFRAKGFRCVFNCLYQSCIIGVPIKDVPNEVFPAEGRTRRQNSIFLRGAKSLTPRVRPDNSVGWRGDRDRTRREEHSVQGLCARRTDLWVTPRPGRSNPPRAGEQHGQDGPTESAFCLGALGVGAATLSP